MTKWITDQDAYKDYTVKFKYAQSIGYALFIDSIWKGWLEKEKSIDIIYYQDYNVSEYRIVTL